MKKLIKVNKKEFEKLMNDALQLTAEENKRALMALEAIWRTDEKTQDIIYRVLKMKLETKETK